MFHLSYATVAWATDTEPQRTDRPRSRTERVAASSTLTTRSPAWPSVIGVAPV